MVKFLEASISMNNKQMNESDFCICSKSSRLYSMYSSFVRDQIVSTSIDAYAVIITAHGCGQKWIIIFTCVHFWYLAFLSRVLGVTQHICLRPPGSILGHISGWRTVEP